jgi:hypothetical protein
VAALADGSIQRNLVDMTSQQATGARPQGSGSAAINMTNLGVVPPLWTPDDLALTNFQVFPASG